MVIGSVSAKLDDFVGVNDSGEELQKLIDVVHA